MTVRKHLVLYSIKVFLIFMIMQYGNNTKNIKLVWEDISKKTNFPNLTDDCVNPKVREFIQKMKKQCLTEA